MAGGRRRVGGGGKRRECCPAGWRARTFCRGLSAGTARQQAAAGGRGRGQSAGAGLGGSCWPRGEVAAPLIAAIAHPCGQARRGPLGLRLWRRTARSAAGQRRKPAPELDRGMGWSAELPSSLGSRLGGRSSSAAAGGLPAASIRAPRHCTAARSVHERWGGMAKPEEQPKPADGKEAPAKGGKEEGFEVRMGRDQPRAPINASASPASPSLERPSDQGAGRPLQPVWHPHAARASLRAAPQAPQRHGRTPAPRGGSRRRRLRSADCFAASSLPAVAAGGGGAERGGPEAEG